jgi:hypothetical protein
MKWQGCQPCVPDIFTPRVVPWYSFLLEALLIRGYDEDEYVVFIGDRMYRGAGCFGASRPEYNY